MTGERHWTVGQRPSGDGQASLGVAPTRAKPQPRQTATEAAEPQQISGVIIGNRNSKVYHLPQGCPSYSQVSERNSVPFDSTAAAEAAGFRRTGNCS